MSEEANKIELRSEEVREIIGTNPSFFVRWNITIVFILFGLIILFSCFIKYPQKIVASFTIEELKKDSTNNNYIAKLKIPIKGAGKIKANQKAYLKVDQYPFMEYGLITESIDNIKLEPTIENNSYYYIAEVKIGKQIKTNSNKTLQYMKGMSGIAEIVINKTPLIYKLIQPLQVLFNRN